MKFRMDELVQVIATALDVVEEEILGASTNHGKRIAILCAAMGRYLGMDEDALSTLTTCAMFHDNALTEYLMEEYDMGSVSKRSQNLPNRHCVYGQDNVDELPLPDSTAGLILYHHEHADGSGPFGKREGEFPLGAELIAIADTIDVNYHLQRTSPEQLPDLVAEIRAASGTLFTARAVEALTHVLDETLLSSLRDERIRETAKTTIPAWEVEPGDQVLLRIADFVARIIDYKSCFTRKHTLEIAILSCMMSEYYSFLPEKRDMIYLACALHDIGKLYVPNEILEKPGPLTDEEFTRIKEHVQYTDTLLKDIHGFEQICTWAGNHHEKLDGSGYPHGKLEPDLDFVSRLIACLDIYQAVSEERPYHPGRTHEETMPIMYEMVQNGKIDRQITEDIDKVLSGYPGSEKQDMKILE